MTISSTDSNDKSAEAGFNSMRVTIMVGLALCALQLANLLYRVDSLPGEVSLRIECAKLMLLGKTPYVDFFVLDAPMALFITVIPVKLAAVLNLLTGYGEAYFTLVFEWLISLGSLALTSSLLLRQKQLGHSLWSQSFLLTIAALNIACTFQFGQPEHFLMLGATPYLVARWLEYGGKKPELWQTIMSGAGAGLAILLDPCYWAVPLAIEFTLLIHFRKFPGRIITTLSLLVATAFALNTAINCFGVTMMNGYRSYILPLLIADRQSFDIYLYGQMSCPDSRIFYYFLAFVTLLAFGIRKRSSIVTPLVIIGWLGMAYHVALCKALFFQALPMFWCSALAASIMGTTLLFDLRRALPSRLARLIKPFPTIICACIATVCGSLLLEQHLQHLADTAAERYQSPSQRQITDVWKVITAKSRKFDKILVLSDSVPPFYPVATLKQRVHGSRIMWSFHLPILAKMKRRPGGEQEHERLFQFYKKILMEDIENNASALILSEQTEAANLIARTDVEKLLRQHYVREEEAQFYSDNLPPREFDNPNYPMWVDSYSQ